METEIDKLSLKINIDGAEQNTADNINAIATAIEALNTAVSNSGALDNLSKYSASLQNVANSLQKTVADMGNLSKIEVPSGGSKENNLPSEQGGESATQEMEKQSDAAKGLIADYDALFSSATKYSNSVKYLEDGTIKTIEKFEIVKDSIRQVTTVINGMVDSVRSVKSLEEDANTTVENTNTNFIEQARAIEEVARQAESLGGRVTTTERVLADGTSETIQKVEYLGDTFKKTEVYVNGALRSMQKMPVVQKELKESTKKSTSAWQKFTKAFGRIAMYRAIRSVLKSITKAMTEGIQNYAKYSESANNSISNIKNSFQQVKDTLGITFGYILEALEPIITALSDKVVELVDNINMAMASMKGEGTYKKAIKQNEDYAKSLDKVNGKLLSFDKFESLNKEGESQETDRYKEVQLGDELPATAQAFKDIFEIIQEIIGAIKKIVDRVKPIIEKILPSVKKLIQIILKSIEDLTPIIGDIVELVLELLDPIIDLIGVITEILTPVVKVVLEAIKKVLEFVVPILRWIIQFITQLVNAIKDNAIPLAYKIQNAIKNIRDWFVNLGNKIIEIGTKIRDFFVNLWHNIANGFAAMINGIVNGFIKFVNILIDGLNLVLKPIDKIAGIFGGNVEIPHWNAQMNWKPYAKGGVPEVGTVFYAGEAGAEIVSTSRSGQTGVANVEQISQAMLQALINYNAAQNGQSSGGNVYLDGRQVGQLVESSVYREGVRVGHFKRA